MGVLNFIVDASQSERLYDHDERIEKLEKDMETARAWIEHLTVRIEHLERQASIDNIKAGAEVNSGDGGYGIGTMEAYEAFVKKRNESLSREDLEYLERNSRTMKPGTFSPESKQHDN